VGIELVSDRDRIPYIDRQVRVSTNRWRYRCRAGWDDAVGSWRTPT